MRFALALAFVAAICGRLGWGALSDRYLGGDRLVPLAVICVLSGLGAAILTAGSVGAVVPLFFASAVLGVSPSREQVPDSATVASRGDSASS